MDFLLLTASVWYVPGTLFFFSCWLWDCVFTAPALVTSLSVTDMLMVLTASFLILLDAAGALFSQKPPIKKTLWGLRE